MKNIKNIKFFLLLVVLVTLNACCLCANNKEINNSFDNREVINQVSLLQGLTFGDYNGSITAAKLKELGDTGIGTFDALNGELIMLDGVVYRAAHDGKIQIVKDSETIPFSNVTFFDDDETIKLNNIKDINTLKNALNKKVASLGKNRFYMVKIKGTFSNMSVRSEYAQKKPYKPLAKVLETDQTFFDYNNIDGTVVGLYCPEYMNSINAVGWHFHFISDDKKVGGHVLNLSAKNINVSVDSTNGFYMIITNNEMFNKFDLTIDQSKDIKKVETGEE